MPTIDHSPLLRVVLLGAGLAIIAAALKATAPVLNLILLSLLLAGTVSPVPYLLTQRGMGRGMAIAVTALVALIGGIALILMLGKSLSRLMANLPQYQVALSALVADVTQALSARGIEVDQALQPNPTRIIQRVAGLLRAGLSLMGYGLFAIVLIVLFLIEMPLVKSADASPGSMRYRLDESMRLVRRFVGLNGLLGIGIAILSLVVMLFLGTDSPLLWTVIIFLFSFVPFGSLISAIPPFLLTLLEQGIGRAVFLFVLFFVINFLSDNVFKPKLMGGGLGISPLIIILSLLAWGFILGPMGALLAIPLTLTLKQILPVLIGEKSPSPSATS